MKASFYHIQYNTSDLKFHRELLTFLGYRFIAEGADFFGATDGHLDIWVMKIEAAFQHLKHQRKAPGLHHLAFRVLHRQDVDAFCRDFLGARGLHPLDGGPKERPDFRPGYYHACFEDPDGVKLEIVFIPA